jgi:hypothetical protein
VGGVAAWRGGTGGGCRWCGFWQSGRVQYNDPAVNRHLSWTRPHSGQATGAPERSHCPVSLMMHEFIPAAPLQRSSVTYPNGQVVTTPRESRYRYAPPVSISWDAVSPPPSEVICAATRGPTTPVMPMSGRVWMAPGFPGATRRSQVSTLPARRLIRAYSEAYDRGIVLPASTEGR